MLKNWFAISNTGRQFARHLSSATEKRHFERRLLNYSQDECYGVVSDVSKYHEFVPWVNQSRVLRLDPGKTMEAELVVGFGVFSERYISHVTLCEPSLVIATSKETNLFHRLKTEWKFSPAKDPRHCWVTFQVDFEFKSAVYNRLSDIFMQDVVNNMVKAFESQCCKIYPQNKKKM